MSPISIPQDVSLKFYDLPSSGIKSRNVDAPTSAIDIAGPQGKEDQGLSHGQADIVQEK